MLRSRRSSSIQHMQRQPYQLAQAYSIPPQYNAYDPSGSLAFFDDFNNIETLNPGLSATICSPFFTRVISAGACLVQVGANLLSGTTAAGIIDLGTAALATDRCSICAGFTSVGGLNPSMGPLTCEWRVSHQLFLSSGAEEFTTHVGIQGGNAVTPNDLFQFNYTRTTSVNWVARVRTNGGAVSSFDTGVPVSLTWDKLKIIIDMTVPVATFWINGQLVATITVPAPAPAPILPVMGIQKTVGTTPRHVWADYCNVFQTFNNAR